MKSKTTKRLWIAVGIGALVLMLLIIVASVINLGEKVGYYTSLCRVRILWT